MQTKRARLGERRWPMAIAALLTGVMRAALPPQLRLDDARPVMFVVLAVLIAVLILATPGGSTASEPGCASLPGCSSG
jgi:hypothetical protein